MLANWPHSLIVAICFTAGTVGSVTAADPLGPDATALKSARTKAVEFLTTSQADDGSWTAPNAPGVSGLVVYGLLSGGAPVDHPAVQKGLKHLESFIQHDGGVYDPASRHGNYETSIVMLAFQAANKDGRYKDRIAAAEKYIRKAQWDENDTEPSDVKFGGAGYGRTGDRPDLSNTSFFLDALQSTGATKDDPAVQKALVFLSRCQNRESEFNTTAFAARVNDGGFYYTPAAGGNSQAGNTPEGGLRSYGSMTYAGLKSMVFAGLTPEDDRVKAALGWIRKFYTVTENPGLGQQGLYYYAQVFAKTLDTLKFDLIEDAAGKSHDWRKELANHLFSLQQPNGSWVNENARWMEGDPNLVTAYSLIALKYCDPKPAQDSK